MIDLLPLLFEGQQRADFKVAGALARAAFLPHPYM